MSEQFIPIINGVLIIWAVVAAIMGYKKGFMWELLRVLGVLASIFISWILSSGLAATINLYPKKWVPFANSAIGELIGDTLYQKLNYVTWFIVIFVVCIIVFSLLKPILNAITEVPVFKQINGLFGSLMSLVSVFFYVSVIIYVLNSAIIPNGKDIVEKSFLRYVQIATDATVGTISNFLQENVAIQKMVSDPNSLTGDDKKTLVQWLKDSQLTSEQIRSFLEEYGINATEINKLLGNE